MRDVYQTKIKNISMYLKRLYDPTKNIQRQKEP